MSGVAGPSEPDAQLAKLRAALEQLDVIRPAALRAPVRDLLRAAIESITRYRTTLGLKVVHELEIAEVILTAHDRDTWTMRADWPEVHFRGGPWDEAHVAVRTVTSPVFAAGSATGQHYWLDQNSDPPTYHWRSP